jgi:Leucine-rich repeat (LRR) protein
LYCSNCKNLTQLPSLDNQINLKCLILYANNLTHLPQLDNLINLEILDCSNNKKLTHIPSLDKLINLTELICSFNKKLTELPNLDKLINLEFLECQNSQLSELTISIRHCKKLYYYKPEFDIPNYQYNEELPDLVNKQIEKYYYKPILDYYNSKYF